MLTDEFVRQATVRAQPGSTRTDWHAAEIDPDDIAVLLMTSGTTAAPKSAVLRHRHLTSYVLESVEFASAAESDATIVSVPPYHIAAVANLLTNLYAGRRIVYLDRFTASEWLSRVRAQGVTHAMVVPTMLVRIVERACQYGSAGSAEPAVPFLWRRQDRTRRARSKRCACSPIPASSTPTGSPRPARRSPCSGPRITARPLRATTRPFAPGSPPWAVPCQASRSRSTTLTGGPALRARSVTLSCAGRRSRVNTWRSVLAWKTAAGSRRATSALSTRTVSSSCRAAPTTPSSAAARTSRLPRSRTCSLGTRGSLTSLSRAARRGMGPPGRRVHRAQAGNAAGRRGTARVRARALAQCKDARPVHLPAGLAQDAHGQDLAAPAR